MSDTGCSFLLCDRGVLHAVRGSGCLHGAIEFDNIDGSVGRGVRGLRMRAGLTSQGPPVSDRGRMGKVTGPNGYEDLMNAVEGARVLSQ